MTVGVGVGEEKGDSVGVGVIVCVGVGVIVCVGVTEGVIVGVTVFVGVTVGVFVCVGVTVGADKTVAAAKAARIKSETEYLSNKEAENKPTNRTIEGKVEKAEKPTTGASGFPLTPSKNLDEIKTYRKSDPLPLAPSKKELERMNQELQKNKDSGVQEGIERSQRKILGGDVSPVTLAAAESPDLQFDRDIKEHRARVSQAQKEGSLAVEPVRRAPNELSDLSVQYNDNVREASQSSPTPAPIIMNNSSNNSTTKIMPMKADPRPSSRGSALDRHIDRVSTY